MSRSCCGGGDCAPSQPGPVHGDADQRAPKRRRFRLLGRGLATGVSSALLILMPKCPVCLAAYVSLATGLGVSITAAAYMRWTAIGLCVAVVAYVCVRAAFDIAARWSLVGVKR